MQLDEYLSGPQRSNADLASKLGVAAALVSQWRTGARPVPIERCVSIEQATEGAVTRIDLRPNDWWLIWPELAERHPERIPDRPAADEPEPEPRGPNPTQSGSGRSPGADLNGVPAEVPACDA